MKRIPQYRRWLLKEADPANYRGLTADDRRWLDAFNKREIETDFRGSEADEIERRSGYRRGYRQRMDALNISVRLVPDVSASKCPHRDRPLDSLVEAIDWHRRIQRLAIRNRCSLSRKFFLGRKSIFTQTQELKDALTESRQNDNPETGESAQSRAKWRFKA